MGDVLLRPNPAFEAEWMRSRGAKLLLEEKLLEGRAIATEQAPFARIASSIGTQVRLTPEGLVGILYAGDWISHFWEFGTINFSARPFLRPAAEAMGTFVQRHSYK